MSKLPKNAWANRSLFQSKPLTNTTTVANVVTTTSDNDAGNRTTITDQYNSTTGKKISTKLSDTKSDTKTTSLSSPQTSPIGTTATNSPAPNPQLALVLSKSSCYKGMHLPNTPYNIYDLVSDQHGCYYTSLVLFNQHPLTELAWIQTYPTKHESSQHYALIDVELCNLNTVLAIGMIHASYSDYKWHFHSFFHSACERSVADYSEQQLKFWEDPENVTASQLCTQLGKGKNEKQMIEAFHAYKQRFQMLFPNITFFYDDPDTDFNSLNKLLSTYKLPLLQGSMYEKPWKNSRDIMRGAFRMIDPKFKSCEARDMQRQIHLLWSKRFKLEATQTGDFDINSKKTDIRTSKEDTRIKVAVVKEFDISGILHIKHLPLTDAYKQMELFFKMEDLRVLFQQSL